MGSEKLPLNRGPIYLSYRLTFSLIFGNIFQMSHEQLDITEIPERRVPLLQQVRERLRADERVYYAGEIIRSPYSIAWAEAVNIIVAPIKPTYNPDELNQFMDSLVPDLPRTSKDEARKYNKLADFQLGRLYFDEVLGTTEKEIKSTTTAVEPEALEKAGISLGVSHKTVEELHRRRTWVRVYPDANSAQLIADYEQGIEDGSVEPNDTLDHMQHWFSADEYKKIKNSGKRFKFRLPKLAKGQ